LLLELARWTYASVGRFIQPTFEQWELGFLRDREPALEIGSWMRLANAFESFLQSRGRDSKAITPEEARLIIGWLLQGDAAAPATSERIEKTGDAAIKKRLEELNRVEVIGELSEFCDKARPVVPAEFIDRVQDASVRQSLRDLNRRVLASMGSS
jgi:hypothetical protein